jgi:hypothetical protein
MPSTMQTQPSVKLEELANKLEINGAPILAVMQCLKRLLQMILLQGRKTLLKVFPESCAKQKERCHKINPAKMIYTFFLPLFHF